MKKKVFIVMFIIMVFGLGVLVNKLLFSNNDIDDSFNDLSPVKHENMLSMMLEQTTGTGDYSLETRSSWPTQEEGYVFNSTLSKCENGSKLRWDDENNAVVMVGTTSDKCYVYFDVYSPSTLIADVCSSGDNLAGCVKKLYQESNSDLTNIYYHDSNLANGAGDNSYRYAGSSDSVNNFVCFGSDAATCPDDNLYRIIGVFGDQVKLIKYDYATTSLIGTGNGTVSDDTTSYYKGSNSTSSIGVYYWNSTDTNTWSTSTLNTTNLNENFINNIGETWSNKIASTTWKVGENTSSNICSATPSNVYKNEITNPDTTIESAYDAKIALMYTSDYGFAASPSAWTTNLNTYNSGSITDANWMYMGLYEWTLLKSSDKSYKCAFYVTSDGDVDYGCCAVSGLLCAKTSIRPVFYLNSNVTKVGSNIGSKTDPIRIE